MDGLVEQMSHRQNYNNWFWV